MLSVKTNICLIIKVRIINWHIHFIANLFLTSWFIGDIILKNNNISSSVEIIQYSQLLMWVDAGLNHIQG